MTSTKPDREGSGQAILKQPLASQQLLDILSRYRSVAIVCHDYPDPDAIASGWAIYELVNQKLGLPVRLVARGQVLRPENRTLIELLEPPLELVDKNARLPPDTAGVLVDCEPTANNHLLSGAGQFPVATIDHHIAERSIQPLAFRDVRPDLAATASIAASYLRDQLVIPNARLATALLYALHTETRGGETNHTPLDHAMLTWLTGLSNPTWLAQIETAPFDCSHLNELSQALSATVLHGDSAFCFLPECTQLGLVAEVADLLIRCEQLHHVFCGATFGNDLLISIRIDKPTIHAGHVAQQLVEGLGSGGGHEHRSGAKIPDLVARGLDIDSLRGELLARWLQLCRAKAYPPTWLVEGARDRDDVVHIPAMPLEGDRPPRSTQFVMQVTSVANSLKPRNCR